MMIVIITRMDSTDIPHQSDELKTIYVGIIIQYSLPNENKKNIHTISGRPTIFLIWKMVYLDFTMEIDFLIKAA